MNRQRAWRCALRTGLITAIGLLFVSGNSLTAAVSQWNSDNSGNFSNPANWDSGIPGLADTAIFRRPGANYSVEFAGDVVSDKLRVGSNTVTYLPSATGGTFKLNNSATTNTNLGTIIGEIAGDTATVNTHLPSFTAVNVDIGQAIGSKGTLNVLAGTFTASSNLTVGKSGTGTVNLSNGATINATTTLGAFAGSNGTATITGSGSTWNRSITVGLLGEGRLDITDGGVLNGALTIGRESSALGAVTIDGPGSAVTSNSSVFVGFFGSGTLAITNGGRMQSGGATVPASSFNSMNSGGVIVDGPGSAWISSGSLFFGSSGPGSLSISNGAIVSSADSKVGSANGTSKVTVDGAGSKWTIINELRIAESGSGTLDITNGGQVTTGTANNVIGGGNSLGEGKVRVDGPGSTWTSNYNLTAGENGAGQLSITNGGKVTVANNAGIGGTAIVDGAGSRWDIVGNLRLGGELLIRNGGQVTCGRSSTDNFEEFSQIAIQGAGSSLTIAGPLNIGRTVNLSVTDNATLAVNDLVFISFGQLYGIGEISGHVENYNGIVGPGTSAGTLTIGGNYTQRELAGLRIELGGIVPGTGFDEFVVTGNTMLAGTLQVLLLDGFTPSLGDSFDILDWGTLNGKFSTLDLPALTDGLVWDTSKLYVRGEISVAAVPEPASFALAVIGLAMLRRFRRGQKPSDHRGGGARNPWA